jgi:hypothetical protein
LQLVPLRTWQTLTLLLAQHLRCELPTAGRAGYITMTREEAQQLQDLLEFDGRLLPPLSDADQATVAELRELLAYPGRDGLPGDRGGRRALGSD